MTVLPSITLATGETADSWSVIAQRSAGVVVLYAVVRCAAAIFLGV